MDEQLSALDTCKNCNKQIGMLVTEYKKVGLVQQWVHFTAGGYQQRCEEQLTVADPQDPYKYIDWIKEDKDA